MRDCKEDSYRSHLNKSKLWPYLGGRRWKHTGRQRKGEDPRKERGLGRSDNGHENCCFAVVGQAARRRQFLFAVHTA